MLTAESIHKQYPTRGEDLVVLRDVWLALNAGESAAIMGPSGSGKSTLLNILGTLEPPSAGQLVFDGVKPYELSERNLARFRNHHVGFVFQEHHLLPQCSVLENVLLPTLADRTAVRSFRRPRALLLHDSLEVELGQPRVADAPGRARKLLERVGLSGRLDHVPAELSGGERQRVAIARALVNRPELLLADEPTGNLDRATAEKVAELLIELHRAENNMLLVVTHSPLLAERFARRFELLDGRLTCQV